MGIDSNSKGTGGGFRACLSIMGGTTSEKIPEMIQDFSNVVIPFGPLDVYQLVNTASAEHTLFSNARGALSGVDRMLSHKTSLGQLKMVEIIHRTPSLLAVRAQNCGAPGKVCLLPWDVMFALMASYFEPEVGGWGATGRAA